MNIDYETALVCAAVNDEQAFLHGKSLRLTDGAFTHPNAAAIWQAMSDNLDNGQPHSQVELWMRLKHSHPDRHKEINEWYAGIASAITDTSAHKKWAQYVAEEWTERTKRQVVGDAWQMYNEGAKAHDVAMFLSEQLDRAENITELEEEKLKRQRESVTDRVRQRILGTGDVIKTGIPELDRNFGSIQSHEFIVGAARPGCGKSSLVRQMMMEHVRDSKKPVMLFSLEMGTDQVIQAMASQNCGVSSWRIEDDFQPRQEQLIAETERFAGALGTYFFIHDDVYKIGDIEHKIHMAARRHKPSMIFIDYLQLIEPPHGRGMNREQQVAYISRRLKQMAQMYRIPIMCLCQMSRDYEKENRRPRLSDLRESGSLEQDADRVWFIHSEKDAVPDGGVYPVKLIQEKCRGGAQYTLDIGFKKSITKFMFTKPITKEGLYDA